MNTLYMGVASNFTNMYLLTTRFICLIADHDELHSLLRSKEYFSSIHIFYGQEFL